MLIMISMHLLVLSVDNRCKLFGPRFGSKLFETLMVFLNSFFENVNFEEEKRADQKT